MEAQIGSNRDEHICSIARIFDNNGNVVGTGFLAAPDYVLTCAHVVLQAIGVNISSEEELCSYDAAPQESISLDFPMTPQGQIKAKVVVWRAYKLDAMDRGDIAGLKLLDATPPQSQPIPILRCSYKEMQTEDHLVYGFPDRIGSPAEAYRPKRLPVRERFLLAKARDLSDETIRPGFSGAPVWNCDRQGVIGMIASVPDTEGERDTKAYAITEESLSSVIQEIFAHHLYDCLCSHLEADRPKIKRAIEAAFWLCDIEGNRAASEQLLDCLLYLCTLSNRTWHQEDYDVDRLTQFALFLVVMDGLPEALIDEIAAWVRVRNFDFDDLYVKANRYRQQRQVSSAEASAHLIVQIRPDEQNAQNVYVSIWVISDRNGCDPLEPRPAVVQDRVIPFIDLPSFLENWLQEESALDSPMVHCFMARHRLGCNLDACETESGLTLGSQYKFVMRTDLTQSPTGKQYYTRWQSKWQSLEDKQQSMARKAFVRSSCQDRKQLYKQLQSAEMAILDDLDCDRVDEVLKFIADKIALPVVFWVRKNELRPEIDRLLDCRVMNLPDRVFEERLEAIGGDDNHLGCHLSLVWEDPKVIPPTMVTLLMQ